MSDMCPRRECIEWNAKYDRKIWIHPVTNIAICQLCGGTKIDNEDWQWLCKTCNKQVEPGELKGLFIPHSCQSCLDEMIVNDKKNGRVCRNGHPYTLCYC